MALSIERVDDLMVVGANGGGWVAPLGTPAPSGLDAPASPYLALGAISDDGLVIGFDEDSESFTPWGLSTPARTEITSSVRTFQVTLWETARPIVQAVMYRLNVDDLVADEDGLVTFAESASPGPDRRTWIFDVYDGSNVARRFYAPAAEITDRDDLAFKQDTMSGYTVTITAYPDDSNVSIYQTILAPQYTPPASS